MNADAERFVRPIESECLDQVIVLGRGSLVRTITEYVAHCHKEPSRLFTGGKRCFVAHIKIANILIQNRFAPVFSGHWTSTDAHYRWT